LGDGLNKIETGDILTALKTGPYAAFGNFGVVGVEPSDVVFVSVWSIQDSSL
jgi:hypothetical protein